MCVRPCRRHAGRADIVHALKPKAPQFAVCGTRQLFKQCHLVPANQFKKGVVSPALGHQLRSPLDATARLRAFGDRLPGPPLRQIQSERDDNGSQGREGLAGTVDGAPYLLGAALIKIPIEPLCLKADNRVVLKPSVHGEMSPKRAAASWSPPGDKASTTPPGLPGAALTSPGGLCHRRDRVMNSLPRGGPMPRTFTMSELTGERAASRGAGAGAAREAASAPRVGNQAAGRLLDGHTARDLALAGLSGGRALPHVDHLQPLFGRYALDGIRSHEGPSTRAAAARLGATGFALGEDVGFTRPPTLVEAAHEATHVVAQRARVMPSDGLGRSGDRFEKLAESVADRAGRGLSVERVLDGAVGRGGERPQPGAQPAAVQLMIGDGAEVGDRVRDSEGTTYVIEAVRIEEDGARVYELGHPAFMSSATLSVRADEDGWALGVAMRAEPEAKFKKPSFWKRATGKIREKKEAYDRRKAKGAHAYGEVTGEEYDDEEDFAAEDAISHSRSMFAHVASAGFGADAPKKKGKRAKVTKALDTASTVSQVGLDRVVDRIVEGTVESAAADITRRLPRGKAAMFEIKCGQLCGVLSSVIQTVVPVVGGALSAPATAASSTLESHGEGLDLKRSAGKGALTAGKDAVIEAVPGYGNVVGFLHLCQDLDKLFSWDSGPTKVETVKALQGQREALLAIVGELEAEGIDVRANLPQLSRALATVEHYLEYYQAKLRRQQAKGKARLLKHGDLALDS
ncbi:MAG: DUF4157 domain-containing protein [Myxococcales bacterium]|nr:DUF4157 domain-containing protein [Myxococcales bacterium]